MKAATPRLPKQSHLRLWYEFSKLVDAKLWRGGWNERLRVATGETFEDWLRRNREHFVLIQNYGLVEHESPAEFEKHFIPDFYEAHISINLYAPIEMIRDEFNALLKRRHKRRGIPDAAEFRLNGEVDDAVQEALERVLKVLQAPKELSNEEVAELCLGSRFKDAASARSAVSQARARGAAILRSIPEGKFPFPERPAHDWSGRQARVEITTHRLLDE